MQQQSVKSNDSREFRKTPTWWRRNTYLPLVNNGVGELCICVACRQCVSRSQQKMIRVSETHQKDPSTHGKMRHDRFERLKWNWTHARGTCLYTWWDKTRMSILNKKFLSYHSTCRILIIVLFGSRSQMDWVKYENVE